MTRVQVYRNLNRGDWSIRANGRVIAHVEACALRDVTFHVQAGAQARVQAGAPRSVHAWAVGELAESDIIGRDWIPITYRPRERSTFYRRDTGAAVTRARFVLFTARQGAMAEGVE